MYGKRHQLLRNDCEKTNKEACDDEPLNEFASAALINTITSAVTVIRMRVCAVHAPLILQFNDWVR